jgi:cardiolipin synthase
MPENRTPRGWFWRVTVGFVVFHVLRHFPSWTGWLPAHKPRLKPFVHEERPDHDASSHR